MTLLLWLFVCWFLPAASAVPLIKLLVEAHAILLCILLGLSRGNFCDGREGVNVFLSLKGWLIVDERWLNVVRYAAKRDRSVSIIYETLRTADEFSGEDFQNTGTFIVVKPSVFSRCSAQKTHLARDA